MEVRLKLWPLYPRQKSPLYQFDGKWVSRSRRSKEEKTLCPCRESNIGLPNSKQASKQTNKQTELYRGSAQMLPRKIMAKEGAAYCDFCTGRSGCSWV
jgi:hypothetical protein